MSVVRYDRYAHYVVANGSIVRPFKGKVTAHKAGDKVKVRHVRQSSMFRVDNEWWVAVGFSKEMCSARGVPFISPPPVAEHGGDYHP